LGPSHRGGTQIDHPRAGLKKLEAIVELDELEGRALSR